MGCRADRDGERIFHPAHYTEAFKDHDVTTVVQLDTLPCTRPAPLAWAARGARLRVAER